MTWLEPRDMSVRWVLAVCVEPESTPSAGSCGGPSATEARVARLRRVRRLGAQIERAIDSQALERVVLIPSSGSSDLEALLEGFLLRAHACVEFTPDEQSTSVISITICTGDGRTSARELRSRVKPIQIAAEATNLARRLCDLPSNVGTPEEIATRAAQSARALGLKIRVFGPDRAKREQMNLMLAVGQGSSHPLRVLILEHDPGKKGQQPTLVFIGKGVTHDTGGYNLKSGARIHEMSYDKAGATAVIGAVHGIARLGLPVRVIGIAPLVENAISAQALKPGDILTTGDGTSVFVENTDAEGRLVLADALTYAQRYRPDLVVDVATLTDASSVALGEPYAALYCNNDQARTLLTQAGRDSGDLLWPMPIDAEHVAQLRHARAHLRNSGPREGAGSVAAAFLRHFVDYPWAHVDMGDRGYTAHDRGEFGPGATGFGTRLLIELARRFT